MASKIPSTIREDPWACIFSTPRLKIIATLGLVEGLRRYRYVFEMSLTGDDRAQGWEDIVEVSSRLERFFHTRSSLLSRMKGFSCTVFA